MIASCATEMIRKGLPSVARRITLRLIGGSPGVTEPAWTRSGKHTHGARTDHVSEAMRRQVLQGDTQRRERPVAVARAQSTNNRYRSARTPLASMLTSGVSAIDTVHSAGGSITSGGGWFLPSRGVNTSNNASRA